MTFSFTASLWCSFSVYNTSLSEYIFVYTFASHNLLIHLQRTLFTPSYALLNLKLSIKIYGFLRLLVINCADITVAYFS